MTCVGTWLGSSPGSATASWPGTPRAADRLRFLYGTDVAPSEPLRALEHRLRTTWDVRGRILSQLGGALDPAAEHRLRTDFLDLGILWADLHVRLASGHEADARRDALRTLDEAERLFGPSPVLARASVARRGPGPDRPGPRGCALRRRNSPRGPPGNITPSAARCSRPVPSRPPPSNSTGPPTSNLWTSWAQFSQGSARTADAASTRP